RPLSYGVSGAAPNHARIRAVLLQERSEPRRECGVTLTLHLLQACLRERGPYSQEFVRKFGNLRELPENRCYHLAAMTDEELIAVADKLVGEFRTSEDCTAG